MSAKRTSFLLQGCGRQHGAALMVMLVILIIGAAAILVSALSSSSLKIERDKTTADALAKAKAALIGYAVSDPNRPGELPCPDFDNDGASTPTNDYSGSNCKSLIGWLPWKTLGISELRDGNGDHLWYALADPFHANGSATLNSDAPTAYSAQMLTIKDGASGATLESGLIAIVFSPGAVLSGETRSVSDNNATNAIVNYLEDENANLDTVFKTANSLINDRLLSINSNALLAPVEMRIAREAKQCLDNYAASNTNNRYPWAVPDNTYPSAIGTYNTLFGRISAYPNIDISSQPASALMTALNVLQAAESAYKASNSSANLTALQNAANTVIGLNSSVTNVSSTTIDQAGDYGNNYANGTSSYSTAASYATTAVNALNSSGDLSSGMSLSWPATCTILTNPSSYFWTAWNSEVFYQVASGNSPTGISGGCVNSCLSISGSGNPNPGSGTYTAAVIVGRAHSTTLNSGSPTSDPPVYYLEGINQNDGTPGSCSSPPFPGGKHDSSKNYSTCPMLSQKFVTYRPTDPSYSSVNDLVLCLDGNNNCK